MKNFAYGAWLCILMLSWHSQAALITVAADNADNYNSQWQGNGGFGFEDWHFIADKASGSAGGFLANKTSNTDLNHAASSPNNKAWGSYANGSGFNQFEAYRGFGLNGLETTGDKFKFSFEHGDIEQGGSVGFSLRNQNIHDNIGDYNQLSRFEFGFVGGGTNYSIWDGYNGQIDTGIAFSNEGLNVVFTLLTSNIYNLDIYHANGNQFIKSMNGTLKGSGSLDSLAFYNRNIEFANAYANNLSIEKLSLVSTPVPEPVTWWLLLIATLLLVRKLKLY